MKYLSILPVLVILLFSLSNCKEDGVTKIERDTITVLKTETKTVFQAPPLDFNTKLLNKELAGVWQMVSIQIKAWDSDDNTTWTVFGNQGAALCVGLDTLLHTFKDAPKQLTMTNVNDSLNVTPIYSCSTKVEKLYWQISVDDRTGSDNTNWITHQPLIINERKKADNKVNEIFQVGFINTMYPRPTDTGAIVNNTLILYLTFSASEAGNFPQTYIIKYAKQ